ncbi:plasmid replication initiator TrfA [Thioalkalivibrio halophilus]|uniref:TrfA family protein n=1 Tax=Thioalkalivibrio halophilus TaxID=252474 RepID=A0A1V2ZVL7_9GAMM|nr:plasmid replication initiator TrfA [Thioalkalivibrio halophilus]OOC08863.1 hypothetical protein B1A74_14000 [Thioalkalivibrio halophilus]
MDVVERARLLAEKYSSNSENHEEQDQGQEPRTVPLPFWSANHYGAPVSILRSALFGVVKRGRRAYYEGEEITAWRGTTIRYTGPRLDQADEDVWLQILQLHQEQENTGLGTRFEVSIKGLLRELDRADGKRNREWLRKSLTRLVATAVSVQAENKEYVGSLVQEFVRNEETGRYTISVNPRLASLFRHGWTKLERAQRLGLGQDQTAKWLHSFIFTHRGKPLHISWEKLQALGGSESSLREYRRSGRRALSTLSEIGAIHSWSDDGRNVTIWR